MAAMESEVTSAVTVLVAVAAAGAVASQFKDPAQIKLKLYYCSDDY